jgi:hypothetical protein
MTTSDRLELAAILLTGIIGLVSIFSILAI